MNSAPELLPCPCCSGEAEKRGRFDVKCSGCGLEINSLSPEKDWNRRPAALAKQGSPMNRNQGSPPPNRDSLEAEQLAYEIISDLHSILGSKMDGHIREIRVKIQERIANEIVALSPPEPDEQDYATAEVIDAAIAQGKRSQSLIPSLSPPADTECLGCVAAHSGSVIYNHLHTCSQSGQVSDRLSAGDAPNANLEHGGGKSMRPLDASYGPPADTVERARELIDSCAVDGDVAPSGRLYVTVAHDTLARRISAALVEKEGKWQPIETAPREQSILGGWYYNEGMWCWGRCEYDHGWYSISGGKPTHWMPLPSPPEAARTSEKGKQP